jgi:predicted O-methyltransferase YrrM
MESWILDLGLKRSIDNARIAIEPLYSLSEALDRRKPYFGRRLSAFQSPPVRYALLAGVAAYSLRGKLKVRVLEIGSWAGASSITLGTAIRQLGISDGVITCVDSWEPHFVPGDDALHYKSMSVAAVTGAIQRLFHHNLRACEISEMIEVVKAGSRDALPSFKDESFDFIYIDGSHKKEDVSYDIEQAKRLLSGDDLELVKNEIDEIAHWEAVRRDVDFVRDPRSGASYHPGVTEAVSTAFGGVWHHHGLWCVTRSGREWEAPVIPTTDVDIPVHLQHAVEIPYGIFKDYELFQLGEQFVAYPMSQPFWFQHRLMQRSLEELVLMIAGLDTGSRTELIEEGYCCFNIVRHNGGWYGFHQALGPTDITALRDAEIQDMKRNGTCVSGVSAADVKAGILGLVMAQLDQRITDETDILYRALRVVFRKMGSDNLFERKEFKS